MVVICKVYKSTFGLNFEAVVLLSDRSFPIWKLRYSHRTSGRGIPTASVHYILLLFCRTTSESLYMNILTYNEK